MTDPSETQTDSPIEEELTQLISYLDGEMDAGQMTEIENQFVSNPAMRSHADILSKTWSLLDELDDVPASEAFTQATMASIATETVSTDGQSGPNSVWPSVLAFLAKYKVVPSFLVGLFAGGVGLLLSSSIQEQRMQKPGSDIAIDRMVLDNIDFLPDAGLYEVVPNAEALKALKLPEDSSKANE